MFLIFGPNDTYFFDDRKGNRKWRAWPAFDNYMASHSVGEINNIAFGDDECFFINHAEGALQHRNYMEDPRDHYLAFKKWVFFENIAHDRSTVNVCFGRDGAFFAKSSQGHRWRNVPEGVMDYYQKFTRVDLFMSSRVNTVDLGHNGTYLGIGVDNTWFWDLGDEYAELSRLLGQKGVHSCQWMSLNPFKAQQHFVAFEDGSVHWALPAHWIQDMQSIIQLYAAKRGARIPQSPQTQASTHDPFANFAGQMLNGLSSPPAPPPRPQQGSSGSWKPSWRRTSTQHQQQTASPPPQHSYSHQYVQSPGGASIDWSQYMQSTQNVLDMYNNTLAAGQSQAYQNFQAPSIDGVTGSIDTINNGIQLVNNLTAGGSMIGQFVVQGAGAAAACCMM